MDKKKLFIPGPVDVADDVLAAIGVLYKEQHNYKTLVIDTVDWLEDLARKAASYCPDDCIEVIEYGLT